MRLTFISIFIVSSLICNFFALANEPADQSQGTPQRDVKHTSCHDGICASILAFDALLRSAGAPDGQRKVRNPNAVAVRCESKTKESDLPFACPNMKISWQRHDWKEAKYQNFKNDGVEVVLEPKHSYNVVLETIDGKWSQKFSPVRAGDHIQIVVDR